MFEYFCCLKFKDKTHRILILLSTVVFIVIYGLVLVCNVFYYHSHVTPEGNVYSHAHPLSKQDDNQPKKSHHHSKLELLLLFSDNYNLDDFQTEVKAQSIIHFNKNVYHYSMSIISTKYSQDSNRAPPSNIILLS